MNRFPFAHAALLAMWAGITIVRVIAMVFGDTDPTHVPWIAAGIGFVFWHMERAGHHRGEAMSEMPCRVYWGSHGCHRPRGHAGPHVCDTCWDPNDTDGYVGSWPYYGPETRFYGEDAPQYRESGK